MRCLVLFGVCYRFATSGSLPAASFAGICRTNVNVSISRIGGPFCQTMTAKLDCSKCFRMFWRRGRDSEYREPGYTLTYGLLVAIAASVATVAKAPWHILARGFLAARWFFWRQMSGSIKIAPRSGWRVSRPLPWSLHRYASVPVCRPSRVTLTDQAEPKRDSVFAPGYSGGEGGIRSCREWHILPASPSRIAQNCPDRV